MRSRGTLDRLFARLREFWDTEYEFGGTPRLRRRSEQGEGQAKDLEPSGLFSPPPRIDVQEDAEAASLQGPPFPEPKVLDPKSFGAKAKWLPLAEYILNSDWELTTRGDRLVEVVTATSEALSELSDRDSGQYDEGVADYLARKGVNPALLTQQAVRSIRRRYLLGEFGEPQVTRWWP